MRLLKDTQAWKAFINKQISDGALIKHKTDRNFYFYKQYKIEISRSFQGWHYLISEGPDEEDFYFESDQCVNKTSALYWALKFIDEPCDPSLPITFY
jgi:hypothetical protein